MADAESNLGHLQIKFVTKNEQYAVPDLPLTVQGSISNSELNELVNTIIQENQISKHRNVEFDFLIQNELLRTSINEHLLEKELSGEQVVDVEYIERLSAPKPQDGLIHDDWVSSVHCIDGLLLSGCYDCSAHIWNDKGKHLLRIPAGQGPIKTVSWIKNTDDNFSFIMGGQEQVVTHWRWDRSNNAAECLTMFKGHERSIESVSVNAEGSMFASCGWDTFLKIWSLSADSESAESEPKKSRNASGVACQTKIPTMTLKGHRDCVSCVRWADRTEILTCSWDHTLRIWDADECGIKQEMTGNKAFLSCDKSSRNGLILATSADKHIRLFDSRSTEGSVVKQTYTSHTLWVHSVRWSTEDEHLFVSAAQDELVKLWDTRSPRAPLYDLSGHSDKVFCCDWSVPSLIVSGGADCAVRVFGAPPVGK